MQLVWEREALNDRRAWYRYLAEFDPAVAEQADQLLRQRLNHLKTFPELGVARYFPGMRVLIIPELQLLAWYTARNSTICLMRLLHEKQQFPSPL